MNQEQNKSIAVKEQGQLPRSTVFIPTEADWAFMVRWGQQAIRSGMLPSSIRTPEAAAIIVLKGRELGLPFMVAVSHIHIVSGKPCMSAELIQGMARKNLPGLVINILESSSKQARIEFIRPESGSKPFLQEFTWDDATAAKLNGKDVWRQYPAAMLWSRCVTAGLRKVCPEALMGISHTPEELGANVDSEGNIIETTGRTIDHPVMISEEERKEIAVLATRNKLDVDSMKRLLLSKYEVPSSKELTRDQYLKLREELESKCDKLVQENAVGMIEEGAFKDFTEGSILKVIDDPMMVK